MMWVSGQKCVSSYETWLNRGVRGSGAAVRIDTLRTSARLWVGSFVAFCGGLRPLGTGWGGPGRAGGTAAAASACRARRLTGIGVGMVERTAGNRPLRRRAHRFTAETSRAGPFSHQHRCRAVVPP